MEMYLHKGMIIKIAEFCSTPKPDSSTIDNNDIPMRDIVDRTSRRVNAAKYKM